MTDHKSNKSENPVAPDSGRGGGRITRTNSLEGVCKVLIVDDNPDDRAELRRMLLLGSDRRYLFTEAETGQACLQTCLESGDNQPDCVILDYHLLDYNAPQLLRALGGLDSPCCPVIVVTRSTEQINSGVILSQGAQDFISKHWINPHSLTRSLENAIERFWINQELKNSRRHFKSFLDNSALIAWMKDEAGNYCYLSENYQKHYNIRLEHKHQKTDFDLWPEQTAKKFRKDDLKVLSNHCTLETVEQALNPDGSLSWWLTTKFPFTDQEGRLYVGGIAIDITERKHAELALQESEEFNRSILNNTADCIKVIDLQGNLILINGPGQCAMELDDSSTVIGKPWVSLWPDQERKLVEEALQTARLGGTGRFQGFCPTTKGTPKWWDVAVNAVLDRAGQPKRFISISRDITERQYNEENLAKVMLQLKTFIQQAPISIAMFDLGMNYLAVSDCWLTLHHFQENVDLIGQNHYQIHPDLQEAWKDVHQQGLAGTIVKNNNDLWIREDGRKFWLKWVVVPWFDENGAIGGIIITDDDITDLKENDIKLAEQAEQLRVADHNKNELLAMLGHELRNPLTPISNAAQLLHSASIDAPTLTKICELLTRNVNHITHLVDDLLDVSRITQGKIKLSQERVELVTLLKDSVESIKDLIQSKQQTLNVDLPAQPIYLDGDSVRLAQIFSNLLMNAAKYTQENGYIDVTVNVEDPTWVTVHVRDNGIGIEPKLLPHIFELFTQGQRELDRSEGGLGLGLALVQKLVDLHGGHVTARSQGTNQGSDFVVSLPRAVVASEQTEPEGAQGLPKEDGQGLRVLMIDDNEDVLDSISLWLELSGYQVKTANNGTKGISVAEGFAPDIILLDIGLPDMDGYQVAKKLREQRTRKRPLIIALSGYGLSMNDRKVIEAGFDHCMAKPTKLSELHELILGYQRSKQSDGHAQPPSDSSG
jgi:PAS domain S-box-containing protein